MFDEYNRNMELNVLVNSNHNPVAFDWKGVRRRVSEVEECWRLTGKWWDGESERTFFRVRTDKSGVYELCFNHTSAVWSMNRVLD